MSECRWCGKALESTAGRREKEYCNPAHRAKYKRADKAAALADLVEKLGPFVTDDGIWVYKELVEHLAGRVNES